MQRRPGASLFTELTLPSFPGSGPIPPGSRANARRADSPADYAYSVGCRDIADANAFGSAQIEADEILKCRSYPRAQFSDVKLPNVKRSEQAIACYQRSLRLHRQLSDRYKMATLLNRLGDAHQAASDSSAASQAWLEALTILDNLDHPDADAVRAKLAVRRPSSAAPTRDRHP
jgi:tetratricopeptide (TPR) repeat protein